jgi:uncharacterized protein involved in cysteine biosynthesis
MKQIISKSLKDMLSKEVILFVLKIGFISFAITLFLTWNLWGTMTALITTYLSWIPWEWLQTSGASVATLSVAYMLFIIIVALLTSLFSEHLLIALAKKQYPDVPVVGSADITKSILLTLKASVVFLLLFILTLPLLFIPILGQVVILYLWSVLLKEPTIYDVGALFIDDKVVLKTKRKKTRVLAMIAALFNFAPIYAQILFLHHILKEEQ